MRDLAQRFYIPQSIKKSLSSLKKQPIWFHAVSVGEINVLVTYLEYFREQFPEIPIVISTITPTGYDVAMLKLTKYTDSIFYFPIDLYHVVKKFCKVINPCQFVAMETELWPELYCQLAKKNIKIAILNGRLSDNSFPSYFKHKRYLKTIMESISALGAQSELMKERFSQIGLDISKITVTGNIKYAINRAEESVLAKLKEKWSQLSDKKVIIAGSTHNPEEEYILDAFAKLKNEIPDLFLFLCPRHVERAKDLNKLAQAKNFKTQLHSEFTGEIGDTQIVILDQIGYLTNLYSIADLVLIGGSFIKHGGQNILEPAVYSKAIVVGPHMYNFSDICNNFIKHDVIIQIDNHYNIYNIFKELLTNPSYTLNIGDNAMKLLSKEARSIELSNKLIADLFNK